MKSISKSNLSNISIKDVARHANVSPATVSRTIQNSKKVALGTKQRVLMSIETLNYYVNEGARSIVKGRTKTIGLNIFDISNPFFPPLARAVDDVVNKFGYSLIIYNTDEKSEKEEKCLKLLLERRVDGLITAPTGHINKYIRDVEKRDIPIVFVDREIKGIQADTVCVDNTHGTFCAVEHLIKLAHKRIGIITWQKGVSTTRKRIQGYFDALKKYNLEIDESLIMEGDATIDKVVDATEALLKLNPPPTAIFSASNLTSLGVLLTLKRLNKKVPQDIALVGFDDVEWGEVSDPPLTVVAQPTYTIGATAAQLLMQRLFQEGPKDKQKIVLKTNLIIRKSCGFYCKREES